MKSSAMPKDRTPQPYAFEPEILREYDIRGIIGETLGPDDARAIGRSFATLLEALNRHRGKGQQKVTVEHVHVHSGGQAVVGVVEPAGGGDRAKSEDQPHAKQIAHAPEPAMRRPDEGREPVPVAGDAERPLPAARRAVAGRAEGQ